MMMITEEYHPEEMQAFATRRPADEGSMHLLTTEAGPAERTRLPHPNVEKHDVRMGHPPLKAAPGLLILRALPTQWVAPSFACLAKSLPCACRRGGSRKCRLPSAFDHVSTTKSNSTRGIAAHPLPRAG
jgi:hypothetical protein